MSEPTDALQVAVAAALLGDTDVTDLVGDHVFDPLSSQGRTYPLIEIGDDQDVGDADTAGDKSEVWSTIHVWANGPGGRRTAKQIVGAIKAVLLGPLTLEGHLVKSALFWSARYLTDGDPTDAGGAVAHAVVVFRFRTVPNP